MRTAKTLIRLGGYWQADLSLRWVHNHIVGFVMSQLIFFEDESKMAVDPAKMICG